MCVSVKGNCVDSHQPAEPVPTILSIIIRTITDRGMVVVPHHHLIHSSSNTTVAAEAAASHGFPPRNFILCQKGTQLFSSEGAKETNYNRCGWGNRKSGHSVRGVP
jgi:hypothetical protein